MRDTEADTEVQAALIEGEQAQANDHLEVVG